MVWEHKKHLIIPVLLSARVTEDHFLSPRRDKHLLCVQKMRDSAKLKQNKELRRREKNKVQTPGH